MKTTLFIILTLIASCTFRKSKLENQTLTGHHELYSEPDREKLQSLGEDEKRIVIASTNDMHGKYAAEGVSFKDDHQKKEQRIFVGGKEVIKNYFSILRDTYKNVVLVDGGDIFSGSGDIQETKDYYESMNYDGVTVGLRDFNLKVPAKIGNNTALFQHFAKSSSVPLLLGNLYELKTARVVEWEGTKPYVLKEVDGLKIGIIGLIPDDIVNQTPINNRIGLYVENMLQSTLRHARLLRSLGADLIVVITHQGIDCNSELASQKKLPLAKVNFEPRQENICNFSKGIGEYLKRLPHQLVDVVVGGRIDQKMANIINDTVVMGSFPDGKSFNYAEFVVNTKLKKVVPEKTVVHQPVMFCHEFFKETKDCFTEDASIDHKKRIPATFLGAPVTPGSDAEISSLPIQKTRNFQKGMKALHADLTYFPESSGETQLVVFKVLGADLLKILEEDYNHGAKNRWLPSPYLVKGNQLTLSLAGMSLGLDKEYRVLSDLESALKHRFLRRLVSRSETESAPSLSWSNSSEDQVSVKMAGPAR